MGLYIGTTLLAGTTAAGGALPSVTNITSVDGNTAINVQNDGSVTIENGIIQQTEGVRSLSTTDRDALTRVEQGNITYNLTDSVVQVYDGTNWANVTPAAEELTGALLPDAIQGPKSKRHNWYSVLEWNTSSIRRIRGQHS